MNSLQKFAALKKVSAMKKAAVAAYIIKWASEEECEQESSAPCGKGSLCNGGSLVSGLAGLLGRKKKKKKRPSDAELEAMLKEE